ncbi:hypothetical protein STENM327S_08774 [Streptomyces tendae]
MSFIRRTPRRFSSSAGLKDVIARSRTSTGARTAEVRPRTALPGTPGTTCIPAPSGSSVLVRSIRSTVR